MDGELLSPETFRPHVGSDFCIIDAGPPVVLRLDRLETHARQAHVRDPFSLFFLGPPGDVLPQRTYRMEHKMGTLDVFLVPIAADENGVIYEAVFA